MASPIPLGSEAYTKLVQAVTEQVLAQSRAEITSLRTKITQLEARIELESNKRIQLEDEVFMLREQQQQQQPRKRTLNLSKRGSTDTTNDISSTSSSPRGSPREFEMGLGGSNGHIENEATSWVNTTASNSTSSLPTINHSNPSTPRNHEQTDTSHRKKTFLDGPDNRKTEWVKAPLRSNSFDMTKLGDTVLFDTVSDRTVREGSLEKMGGTRKGWRVRWFRLQQGSLFYYKTPKDKKAKGEIVLNNCNIFRSSTRRQFEFTISVPDRDWLLCAKDEEEANQWVEAIKSCSVQGSITYL